MNVVHLSEVNVLHAVVVLQMYTDNNKLLFFFLKSVIQKLSYSS